jgi:molybdopterin converting factor subunit 1
MATVKVRLFARLAEIAGTRHAELELGEGLTAGEVPAVLARQYPGIDTVRVAVAVNQEYAEPDRPLRPGDEVALIPPVSGGAS